MLEKERQDVLANHSETLSELREEYHNLHQEYMDIRADITEAIMDYEPALTSKQKELAAIIEKVHRAYAMVDAEMGQKEIELPPLPEGDSEGDPEGILYDSKRDYFEQLGYHKSKKGAKA